MTRITYKHHRYFYRLFGCIILFVGLSTLLTSNHVLGIARGYITNDTSLQVGMVAALSTDTSENNLVERATQESEERAVGVVTTIDDALITVASAKAKVLIETEGEVEAYVSDVGGLVRKGDLLTLSPLKGILMKASDTSPTILAVSNADFVIEASQEYTFTDAQVKSARISRLTVSLNRKATGNNSQVIADTTLRKIGRSIVGKDVGEIRVLIALIIFFIVLIAEGGILYGAISSAIIALGRNPLAGKIIRRELIRVVFIAFVVLGVGLLSIYGILWI